MAIYRFRITFEDYDDVIREIDMLSKHTFLDFHQAIHQATGYNPALSSSFYVSNDQWKKGEEIAYLPSERKLNNDIKLMEDSKLSKYVNDPHQKFYYTYNFERPFDFHVQLIKILKEEEEKEYPILFRSMGKAPLPFGSISLVTDTTDGTTSDKKDEEDYDFLNETEYGIDQEEDLNMLDEDESQGEQGEESSDQNFGADY